MVILILRDQHRKTVTFNDRLTLLSHLPFGRLSGFAKNMLFDSRFAVSAFRVQDGILQDFNNNVLFPK